MDDVFLKAVSITKYTDCLMCVIDILSLSHGLPGDIQVQGKRQDQKITPLQMILGNSTLTDNMRT